MENKNNVLLKYLKNEINEKEKIIQNINIQRDLLQKVGKEKEEKEKIKGNIITEYNKKWEIENIIHKKEQIIKDVVYNFNLTDELKKELRNEIDEKEKILQNIIHQYESIDKIYKEIKEKEEIIKKIIKELSTHKIIDYETYTYFSNSKLLQLISRKTLELEDELREKKKNMEKIQDEILINNINLYPEYSNLLNKINELYKIIDYTNSIDDCKLFRNIRDFFDIDNEYFSEDSEPYEIVNEVHHQMNDKIYDLKCELKQLEKDCQSIELKMEINEFFNKKIQELYDLVDY